MKASMKIAFFTNAFPMMSEAFIANSAAALVDAGHSVDIFGIGNVDATGLSVPEIEPLHLEQSTTNIRWPDSRATRWRQLPETLRTLVRNMGPAASSGYARTSIAARSWTFRRFTRPRSCPHRGTTTSFTASSLRLLSMLSSIAGPASCPASWSSISAAMTSPN